MVLHKVLDFFANYFSLRKTYWFCGRKNKNVTRQR